MLKGYLWKGRDSGNNKEALWVNWVNTFQVERAMLLGIKERSTDSWSWSKMLHLRQVIQPFVKKNVNNGETTSYLFDNWHNMGIPAEALSERDISVLRTAATDTVAHAKEVIRRPRGRALTARIVAFNDGFSDRLEENDNDLIWFGSGHHKS
ncbi:hypothetical protein LIER_33528 [Lithospermum erythrorhizon]|uniref:Uncharacterized protein n=1 Tax=Lithospermum erythrorhizon TaxID=34254 RepID=A0AAV3S077_LITER